MTTTKMFSGSFSAHPPPKKTKHAHKHMLKSPKHIEYGVKVGACSTNTCTPSIHSIITHTETATHTQTRAHFKRQATFIYGTHFLCLVVQGQNLWWHVEGFNASLFTLVSRECCLLHLCLVCQGSFTMCISPARRLTITLRLIFFSSICRPLLPSSLYTPCKGIGC